MATVIIGLGLIKVIAEIGPVEYGKYALVLSIVPLVNLSIYNPLDQFSQRFFYTFHNKNESEVFLFVLFNLIKKTAFVLSVIAILSALITGFIASIDWLIFTLIASLYIIIVLNGIPLISILNTVRLRNLVAKLNVGEKFFQLTSLFIVSKLFKINAILVLGTISIVGIFFLVLKWKFIRKNIFKIDTIKIPSNDKKYIYKLLLPFSFPLLLFGVFQWLQTYGERWIIQITLTLKDVGIYTFMGTIANTSLMIIISALSQFIGPILWEKFSDLNDFRKIDIGRRIIKYQVYLVAILTFIASGILYFVGETIIKILGNLSFIRYSQLLPLIFLSIGIFNIGQTLTSIGFGLDKMIKYSYAKIISAILTIVFLLIGSRLFGLFGITIAGMSSGIIYLLFIIQTNRNILKEFYHPKI